MESFGQFCAVARGLEVLGQRWTLLVVRELLCGSTRFNEIRNGIPLIPRSTLVDRLGSLERAGILTRTAGERGEYHLTDAGLALAPVLEQLAQWAHGWDRRGLTDEHLDPEVLIWDLHRRLRTESLPDRRVVIAFVFSDRPADDRRLFLHLGGGAPALCRHGEGFEPDLEVHGDTAALTRWWLGEVTWAEARRAGRITMTGPRDLQRRFPDWFLGYVFPASAAG